MKGAVYLKDKEGLVCEVGGDKPSSWVPGKMISIMGTSGEYGKLFAGQCWYLERKCPFLYKTHINCGKFGSLLVRKYRNKHFFQP